MSSTHTIIPGGWKYARTWQWVVCPTCGPTFLLVSGRGRLDYECFGCKKFVPMNQKHTMYQCATVRWLR